MGRNVNRTIDNASSGFIYTPEQAWGFVKDDGSLAGNTTLLDDFVGNGNTSLAITSSSASVDLTFKGMSDHMLELI
jgi:hypothetical protein